MPLPGPTQIPPIGEQTDPDNVRVAAVVGGQLASAPARGFGLTAAELTAVQAAAGGAYQPAGNYPVKTAEARNRVVNPAMQISQELGDTAVATGASGGGFPTDQWQASWGLTGTANSYRSRPSDTGNDYVVMSIIGATTSPAAGAYCQLLQAIEGVKIKDFLWGTAAAKQAVFRFNLYANVTGTYSMLIKNGAGDRTFLAPFTVTTANAWKSYSIVVPGDTTGTWPTTAVLSMTIGFGFAAGTTYGGGVAGWQAGNKIQITGNTNGAATAGNTFLVTDVGLYLDANSTGLAPPWQMPDEAQELQACQRYYRRWGGTGGSEYFQIGSALSTGSAYFIFQFFPIMRIGPAMSNSAFSNFTMWATGGGAVTVTTMAGGGASTPSNFLLNAQGAGMVAMSATALFTGGAGIIQFSARM